MSQLELFIWTNSFKELFKQFYAKDIPQKPGIYKFYDSNSRLLYVGKSKTLYNRVRSYTHVNPLKHSKRLVQLVQRIALLEWEETKNEKEALLLENDWLRTKKPPFNSANTRPDLHVFIGIKRTNEKLELGWTLSEDHHPFDELFGAFKGLSATYQLLQSLRILGLLIQDYHLITKKHITKRPPNKFEWNFMATDELGYSFLFELIRGESFNIGLVCKQLKLKNGFEERLAEQCLSTVLSWFQWKAIPNRAVKQKLGIKNDLLTKEGLDDWLVKLKF